MMTPDRKEWKQLEPIVRDVIHKWDPYGLLGDGAPQDEFDSQILTIVGRLRGITTPLGCVVAISDVFSASFEPERFGMDDGRQVGQNLFDALKEAGLI
jgi:hypothetical protein